MSQPPSPQSITPTQFSHLLSLYPSVLRRVYERKIKDPAKRAQALEDDAWRYGYESGGSGRGLRDVVEERRGTRRGESKSEGKSGGSSPGGGGGWVEKAELERLVRWKITHGTNRPFLPAQIRKNDPAIVKSATTAAFAAPLETPNPNPNAHPTNSISIPPFPTTPLAHLTTLTGVGPATATLLLSIHDPVTVPFFQDELYWWLCSPGASQGDAPASEGRPGPAGVAGVQKLKLKYNLKEYEQLYEAVGALRRRLSLAGVGGGGGGPGGGGVRADEVERVGFVVGHWLEMEGEERTKVLSGAGDEVLGGDGEGKRKVPDQEEEVVGPVDEKKRKRGSADGEKEKKSVAPARKSHRSNRHS